MTKSKHNCIDCRHCDWKRGFTGRIETSKDARCRCQLPSIKLPACVKQPDWVSLRRPIWHEEVKAGRYNDCPCWERKGLIEGVKE